MQDDNDVGTEWERTEYRGLPIPRNSRNYSKPVVQILAQNFGRFPFASKQAKSVLERTQGEEDERTPGLYSSPTYLKCTHPTYGGLNELYRRGLLERTGRRNRLSYRIVAEALSDLGNF